MNFASTISFVLDSACFSILGIKEVIKELMVAYKIKLV
tara:strand:- start:413 stop:526 length:114 start_codon:yes stop_codon:yes gene_type:complete